jgi:signal peptidase II
MTVEERAVHTRVPWSQRRQLAAWLYSTAAVLYALDRITKVLVEDHLQMRPPIDLIPGVLRLKYTTNPGGAFGLFGNAAWLFLLATALVCAVIVASSLTLSNRALALGLGLVLGGALGNLTDRLVRGSGLSGEVVDFIDFRIWPVFNVADSAIVIGAGLILLAGIRRAASSG